MAALAARVVGPRTFNFFRTNCLRSDITLGVRVREELGRSGHEGLANGVFDARKTRNWTLVSAF